MAEKEGFEPSIPFWGIHDFQSCALGQLRDFSISNHVCGQLAYITLFALVCQAFSLDFLHNFYVVTTTSQKKNKLTYKGITDIITTL